MIIPYTRNLKKVGINRLNFHVRFEQFYYFEVKPLGSGKLLNSQIKLFLLAQNC